MQSKQSFMQERGLFDASTPEYAIAEKEYKHLYQRDWRLKNKSNYRVVKIMLHQKDYAMIKQVAEQNKIPVARLIKNSALASSKGSFYVPPPELLPKAIVAINRIGNLINQQTRWIHTNHVLTEQHYQDLLNHIKTLRESLKNIYSK